MPSVIDAPMKRAEASNSFWPFVLLRCVVERIQINRGILRMRTNVMEFGKFTGSIRYPAEITKTAMTDYPPRANRKAMDGRAADSAGGSPIKRRWFAGSAFL